MNKGNFQVIDDRRLTADERRSIHAQYFDLDYSPREVARQHRITERQAKFIAVEEERKLSAMRADLAFSAGRRSLLTPPPSVERRAA